MFLDTEKNQKFLALMWALQTNGSNAVITPQDRAREILKQKVYRAYDYTKWRYIYSLEPIQDIPRRTDTSTPAEKNVGGRPEILTEEQKEQIKVWKNMSVSNREIARRLKVSEGTIRKFLKDF